MKSELEQKNLFNYKEFSAKEVFLDIRNYLAGRLIGATRDEVLLEELIKLIFSSSIVKNKLDNSTLSAIDLANLYRNSFKQIKEKYISLFAEDEEILLDPDSIEYIHYRIINLNLFSLQRDPIGDAYEIFIGENIKGQSGQFFTPKNAADTLVELTQPRSTDKILDLACGAGGFITSILNYFQLNNLTNSEEIHNLIDNVYGVDKDEYLTTLAKIHVAALTGAVPNIKSADSLIWDKSKLNGFEEKFDIILTNPPFGAKISAGSKETLMNFDLAYKWKKVDGNYVKTDKLATNTPPQVVFMEQCIRLLKDGGKLGIVIPESLLSSKKYSYVVNYIIKKCKIKSVIGMPDNLFKTSGKGGTHTKTCLLVLEKFTNEQVAVDNYPLFLAEAQWCGHDSRGKAIPKDDLPSIVANYKNYKEIMTVEEYSELGFSITSDMIENQILSPRYYNPNILIQSDKLKNTHNLVRIQDLIDEGVLEFQTGDEVGKLAYGTGPIPFVRTSDISNWEIKSDPKQSISEEIYNNIKIKQDVREHDILMVKDGTYLVGTSAIITNYDTEIIYQSHLYKIRVNENIYNLDPYYLLALLSSEYVQDQIKAKTFTQDIINSLGDRYKDLLLPLSKNEDKMKEIAAIVKKSVFERIEARELARQARIDVLKY
ncbi:N-6 DNA methylase [Staphylococcus xylosus]|uniref:N-6 DNA methylase n=1 Tax=Staphylococcus xylosus TaxID=1288 RepID=UPI0031FF4AAB